VSDAPETIDAVAFAKAIADDTRQQIMRICCCERLTVGQIAEQIGVSQPTVSHHLAILRDADLVSVDKQGRESFYSLNQQRMTWCCGQLMLLFAPGQASDSGQQGADDRRLTVDDR
jgi:ArsR family transcriptional regulator, arsenate/arsenite/antimonite-responsive transcriptional repressor